jgi:hypothetical protein
MHFQMLIENEQLRVKTALPIAKTTHYPKWMMIIFGGCRMTLMEHFEA